MGAGCSMGAPEVLHPCVSLDGNALVLFPDNGEPRDLDSRSTGVFYRNGDAAAYADLDNAACEESDGRIWYYDGVNYFAVPCRLYAQRGRAGLRRGRQAVCAGLEPRSATTPPPCGARTGWPKTGAATAEICGKNGGPYSPPFSVSKWFAFRCAPCYNSRRPRTNTPAAARRCLSPAPAAARFGRAAHPHERKGRAVRRLRHLRGLRCRHDLYIPVCVPTGRHHPRLR